MDSPIKERLPSPKGVALAIMHACQRDNVSLGEVARLVQTDPSLTGRLLERANAAEGGRAVIAVADAVSRLGLQSVRQLALSFSLIDQYGSGNCAKFDYSGFWSHSLVMGVAMQEYGLISRLGSSDELFTCGLLARVGCLAMATAHPKEYSEVLSKGNKGADLLESEQQVLRTDHVRMSCVLLAQWGIPQAFLEAVEHHESPAASTLTHGSRPWLLLQAMHLALRTANFLTASQVGSSYQLSELTFQAGQMGMGEDVLAKCVDAIAAQWRSVGNQLKIKSVGLPAFSEMVQAQVRPDQETNTAWLRVLIVEDDHIIRTLLETWLKDACHYTVKTATNGEDALSIALEFTPHVVMTDWLMPVMDGLDLCKSLRASEWGQNIYVLMLTSAESENDLVKAFEAGVDDYLTKPVNMRALSARLKAAWRYVRLRDAWERDHQRLTAAASELALTNRRLQHAALTDPLTELANRRAGLGALSQAWSVSVRHGTPLCVISIDIDHFKSINDTYGHAGGDLVLQRLSQSLRAVVRQEDTVCRWGGEEFMVICPNLALSEGIQMAQRLRKTIASTPTNIEGKPTQITVSLGISEWRMGLQNYEQLLTEADQALYAAKRAGRNCLAVFAHGTAHVASSKHAASAE